MSSIKYFSFFSSCRYQYFFKTVSFFFVRYSGLASYMIFGTELSAGHHNEKFDFDESVMALAVETLARIALNFPWQRGV
ncbi:peptidase subunit A [Klebsiella variicola]|nr:peptidase subunit A [Klebsiella variicola]